MVVLVAREARQVEHDDEVHAALVQAAVREQALELAAVRGLGALARFVEAFKNVAQDACVLTLAIGLSGPFQLLYVFHTTRTGAELGSYESPELTADAVDGFLHQVCG